jgi:hypothetical protein
MEAKRCDSPLQGGWGDYSLKEKKSNSPINQKNGASIRSHRFFMDDSSS